MRSSVPSPPPASRWFAGRSRGGVEGRVCEKRCSVSRQTLQRRRLRGVRALACYLATSGCVPLQSRYTTASVPLVT